MPDLHAGPVLGLVNQQLGSTGTDVMLGTERADFINADASDDAIDGGAGNDVLDGGLGSNFLTGGAGLDRFFLDGRQSRHRPYLDHHHRFCAGEQLTIWGYKPGVSIFLWQASDGVAGYTGASLHCDLDGNGLIDTSVTFSALTRDQVPNQSYGSIEGQDYIFFG